MRLPRKVAFALVPVTLWCLGVELALRLAPAPPERFQSLAGYHGMPPWYSADPSFGWTLKPGAIPGDPIRDDWIRANGGVPGDTEGLAISPEAYRDTPLDHPRPDRQVRIACVGDSSVFGAGVQRLEAFPERLEVALNPSPEPGPRAVEVINTAVPGHSSFQALLRLEEALPLGIDGVVAYLMNSDLMERRSAPDAAYFGSMSPGLWRLLLQHTATGRWLQHQAVEQQQLAPGGGGSRVTRAEFRDNLRRLVDLSKQHDFFVVFVIPPSRSGLARIRPEDVRVHTETDAIAAEEQLASIPPMHREGFNVATALEAFRAGMPLVDGPRLFHEAYSADPAEARGADALFVDPLHPSARGHRLLAEALLPVVQAELDRR
mgnify:CR=1 FL=1